MGFSLYVHVPFCERICTYCDFPRVLHDPRTADATLSLIARVVRALPDGMRERPVATVFFGGGTPSCVPAAAIAAILDAVRQSLRLSPDAEISLEANPEDVTLDWIRAIRDAGVNRISCGVQSFTCAGPLGRRHTPQRAVEAVATLRAAGVDNLNLDLMFALPGQGPAELDRDLDALLALSPEHVSCYGLTLAPGTPLARDHAAGRFATPDDDAWNALYARLQDRLAAAGYGHYEISNWARPGYECRHNLRIWEGADYLGLGPAAVTRWKRWRWTEPVDPEEYVRRASGCAWPGEGPPPWAGQAEVVTATGADIETLLTGTRLLRGFDPARLAGRLEEACICDLRAKGLLWQTDGRIGLTRAGLPVADSVLDCLVAALRGPEERLE